MRRQLLYIAFCVCCWMPFSGSAQYLPKIRPYFSKDLSQVHPDTLFRMLSLTSAVNEPKDSLAALIQACIDLGEQKQIDSLTIQARIRLAMKSNVVGDHQRVLELSSKALAIGDSNDVRLVGLRSSGLILRAASYKKLGKYLDALHDLKYAEKLMLTYPEETAGNMHYIYSFLGEIYDFINQDHLADQYFDKAWEVAQDGGRIAKGSTLYTLIQHYLNTEDKERISLYLNEWVAYKTESEMDYEGGHILFSSIISGDIPGKIAKLHEIIKDKRAKPDDNGTLLNCYLVLSELYQKVDAYDLAEEMYDTLSLIMAPEKYGHMTYLRMLRGKEKVAVMNGQWSKAVATLEQIEELKSSTIDNELKLRIADLENSYELANKEKELREQEISLGRQKKQRDTAILASIFLLAIGSFSLFNIRRRNHQQRLIEENQAQLHRQKIAQLEQEKQLTSLKAMVDGQERERLKISTQLNDSLGSMLSSIKVHFDTYYRSAAGAGNPSLARKTYGLIDQACSEVRKISHNMVPQMLSFNGLSGVLEDLEETLNRAGIDCNLEIIGLDEEQWTDTQKISIYRILQELVQNIIKHADAKNVLLQLLQHAGHLSLIVEDDGKGFDVNDSRFKGGMGLQNIEARVDYLKAKYELDSQPGKGTTYTFKIPSLWKAPLKYS